MQKFINIDPIEPGMVPENTSLLDESSTMFESNAVVNDHDVVIHEADQRPLNETMNTKPQPFSVTDSLPTETTSQPSRTREQKALKEPKSIRK
jgi:hypothetical protein